MASPMPGGERSLMEVILRDEFSEGGWGWWRVGEGRKK